MKSNFTRRRFVGATGVTASLPLLGVIRPQLFTPTPEPEPQHYAMPVYRDGEFKWLRVSEDFAKKVAVIPSFLGFKIGQLPTWEEALASGKLTTTV